VGTTLGTAIGVLPGIGPALTVAVLLPVYLIAIGLGPFEVGIAATLALLGSALMTLGIGLIGARVDQRRLLMAACGLMIATGLAFALSSTYAVVLLVAFMGTINPSSGSVSVFVPLEHAVLARSVADTDRTKMFARYGLIGALAAAVGALASASPDVLAAMGVSRLAALKAMFVLYAVLGAIGAAMYAQIPAEPAPTESKPVAALGPSRSIVYRMAALFSIDSFAGGFAVQSLLALWLFNKFGMSLAAAGVYFFWSGVLAAFSFPIAAWLSRRIGLVNTMVFTHIPSSICLIVAAVAPSLEVALALLLVRAALSQMDVPTRSSYVMAVVTPPERPAAASVTSVPRSSAARPAGDGRRAVRGRLRGLAVHHLRCSQDPLRLRPALGLPPHQAARGTVRPPGPTCSCPSTAERAVTRPCSATSAPDHRPAPAARPGRGRPCAPHR
jgi:MFS family permease